MSKGLGDSGAPYHLTDRTQAWPTFPVWKTIDLGTERTNKDLYNALVREGCCVEEYAYYMLSPFENMVAPEKIQVDLVVLTTAQLTGKKQGGTRDEVFDGAERLHLRRCAEVGPQLRLQYKYQPLNEWLIIGMDPIMTRDGELEIFVVGRNGGGLRLGSRYYPPSYLYDGGRSWVFIRSE